MLNDNTNRIDIEFTEEEEAVFLPEPMVKEKPKAGEKMLTQDEVVITQYTGGMTIRAIQKANNISAGKVYEILARNKVELRVGRYKTSNSALQLDKMTNRDKQLVIDDYLRGVPVLELYDKYRLNKHALYTILDEAGIPRKNKHGVTKIVDEDTVVLPEPTEKIEKSVKLPEQLELTLSTPNAFSMTPGTSEPIVFEKKDNALFITMTKKAFKEIDFVNVKIDLNFDEEQEKK